MQVGSNGTGILVKNSLKFQTIDTIAWNLQTLQTTAVMVETENQHKLLIVSAYRNPGGYILNVNDLDIITQEKNKFIQCNLILGGDFNAKHEYWLNFSRCRSGILLAEWIDRNSTLQRVNLVHTSEPTFYRNTYSSYLDFFII